MHSTFGVPLLMSLNRKYFGVEQIPAQLNYASRVLKSGAYFILCLSDIDSTGHSRYLLYPSLLINLLSFISGKAFLSVMSQGHYLVHIIFDPSE